MLVELIKINQNYEYISMISLRPLTLFTAGLLVATYPWDAYFVWAAF